MQNFISMTSFWDNLPAPFFALAPLEDITDAAFRRLVAEYGAPGVMFTEFTSADGLLLADSEGQEKLRRKLLFSDAERPIVAQLFSAVPEYMERSASLVAEMGFDGIDINMGCPDRTVEKQGCGAAMIRNHAAAREIIRATKRGARGLPVSVKTRSGYSSDDELDAWASTLLAEDIAALTLHARTRKDMSKVPARWELVKRLVEIRNHYQGESLVKTLIVGNGDVRDLDHARELAEESGCDGIMLGRAAIGNPFLFQSSQELWNKNAEEVKEKKILALMRHLELFIEIFGEKGKYPPMKKHMSKYAVGFDGAKELRMKLMQTKDASEARKILLDLM